MARVESLEPDLTCLGGIGVVPCARPNSPDRLNWNHFWKGVNSATGKLQVARGFLSACWVSPARLQFNE